ncbi:MAG TPA: DUF2442 domain-containing protein [Gemmatimonadales bacterium]|nr:DUF2442 domain-containing protein [Gemmatimonadales bacterium]
MRDISAEPRAKAVTVSEGYLAVELIDDRVVSVPVDWFPLLAGGTPEQQSRYELIGRGFGIHWPDLDEDIRVGRLLEPWPERAQAAG